VQHIDHLTEADCVDGAERIAIVPGDDLEHGGIAEAFQHLGVVVLLSLLGGNERIADGPRTSVGMADRSSLALAIQRSGFMPSMPLHCVWYIYHN